jgi:hypothetical protein
MAPTGGTVTDLAEMIRLELVRLVTSRRAMLFSVIAVVCLSSGACLAPRRMGFMIPAHCLKIGVESFTQPCTQRTDGKLVCNGVVITANCVAPQGAN